jgi:Rv0078B-related antitoxin
VQPIIKTLPEHSVRDNLPVMAAELTLEYIATLRRMTGAEKLRTAFDLYWSARKLKAARLRQQHPDWSEAAVQQRVKEIFMHAVT